MNEQLFKVKVVQIIFKSYYFLLCSTISLFGQQSKVITQIGITIFTNIGAYNEDGSIHQKGMYIGTEDGEYLPILIGVMM